MRPPTTSALAVAAGALLLGPLSGLGASPEPTSSEPTAPEPTSTFPTGETTEPGSPTPREGGTLRHQLADPASIDPGSVADDAGRTVVDAVFDSLTAVNADGRVVPAAAPRWSVSPDATVFTFELDPDATFHDGSPVVAADFVRAFARVVTGPAGREPTSAPLLEPVVGYAAARLDGAPLAGVTAPDDHTLRIELGEPRGSFPAVLADPALAPIPPVAEEDPEGFGLQPVGNGPFRLAEPWDHGDAIRVTPFEDHPGPIPLLDEVVFELYTGPHADGSAFADLEAGELDVATAPPFATVTPPRATATGDAIGHRVVHGGSRDTWFLGFPVQRSPFDDPGVRRALSLLADRTAMTRVVPQGSATAATALVPPGIAGHEPEACDYCTYDPVAARTLLDGAGVASLRIVVQDELMHRSIADRFAGDATAEAGIETEVVAVPLTDFIDELDRGDADVFLMAWRPQAPTPDEIVTPLFASSRIGTTNVTGYETPYVDELLARARRTTDDEARLALYERAEEHALDDAVVAPLLHAHADIAVADHVHGYEPGPTGRADLTQVWIEEA